MDEPPPAPLEPAGHQDADDAVPVRGSLHVEKPTPAERREQTAAIIAYSLICILAGTLISLFVFAFLRTVDGTRVIAEITIPPLTTLVGSVAGYYYGSEKRHG